MEKKNALLTLAEMGKLWATYTGNTMGKCVISYYLKHVEDKDTKKVLEYALDLCNSFSERIKTFFVQYNFPIPVGMTADDVNLGAPRLYYDDFYLHYLRYLAKAGISIYGSAISVMTRKDVRDFFVGSLNDTVKLLTLVNDVLQSKGLLMNPPPAPSPKKVDFVQKQDFLNGFLGEIRPLHGLEVAHLYDNLHNDITSKALVLGFCQVAKNGDVKKFLKRGNDINQKHIEIMSHKLYKENLPPPSPIDYLVGTSNIPPFSDKLMVFHKIDMFSMKIREYADGSSLNGRRDIGTMYARCLLDVSLYIEDGANILIEHGWMEQPPEVVDRDELLQ
jgi:hypothetical protein